jgi:hypothetical protein
MELVEVSSNNHDMLHIYKHDRFGGVNYNLAFSQEMVDMFNWYKQYKAQMLLESQAREQNPSIAAAYEQYQTMLKLVLDQV